MLAVFSASDDPPFLRLPTTTADYDYDYDYDYDHVHVHVGYADSTKSGLARGEPALAENRRRRQKRRP